MEVVFASFKGFCTMAGSNRKSDEFLPGEIGKGSVRNNFMPELVIKQYFKRM